MCLSYVVLCASVLFNKNKLIKEKENKPKTFPTLGALEAHSSGFPKTAPLQPDC